MVTALDRQASILNVLILIAAVGVRQLVAAQDSGTLKIFHQPLPGGLPRSDAGNASSVAGIVRSAEGLALPGATVVLSGVAPSKPDGASRRPITATTRRDGSFVILEIAPGSYTLSISLPGYGPIRSEPLSIRPRDIVSIEGRMKAAKVQAGDMQLLRPETSDNRTAALPEDLESRKLLRREINIVEPPAEVQPNDADLFTPVGNRWGYRYPAFRRYNDGGDTQFVAGHWYDPFNVNRLKGDYAIIGNRTFLALGALSDSSTEVRRLPFAPLPSRAPGGFRLGQEALAQVFALSVDLLHGDASYRPADWRIRLTVNTSLSDASVGKPGLLNFTNPQVTRFAIQTTGVQEAFVEKKLFDLSDAYDALSLRAGIQNFNSDFRGFIFATSAPGMRLFGNLGSNRYQYNLAAFDMLAKDANSGLNTLVRRRQQVFIANLYRQDFLAPGYTLELSVYYDNDHPSTAFNVNNFQVRPAPDIGVAVAHAVRALYIGVAGDGHIGPVNISHAIYQVFGHDSFNSIAARPVAINARMAAIETSIDRDWIRYRLSAFYASGDRDPRSHVATGFDAILNNTNFAGGLFSFWNREILNFSGRGVALTAGSGLLPDLRAGLSSGQANFVNPGLMLANAGTDLRISPKLRLILNLNLIRFADTAPLEQLLGIAHIPSSAGIDGGVGVRFRPALNDNIVFTTGVTTLFPAAGLRRIYSGGPFPAAFTDLQFRF